MSQFDSVVVSTLHSELLDGPRRPLRVVHQSRHAWQLVAAEWGGAEHVVGCLATPQAVRLPHTMVVAGLPGVPPPISVGDGSLVVGDREFHVARWFRPARPVVARLAGFMRPDHTLDEIASRWPAQVGRGPGLTPYADDVICGALVALNAAGHPHSAAWADGVRRLPLERRTTATSASLLRLAADGWCIDPVADWLTVAGAGGDLTRANEELAAVGHSSGLGLLEGLRGVLQVDIRKAVA